MQLDDFRISFVWHDIRDLKLGLEQGNYLWCMRSLIVVGFSSFYLVIYEGLWGCSCFRTNRYFFTPKPHFCILVLVVHSDRLTTRSRASIMYSVYWVCKYGYHNFFILIILRTSRWSKAYLGRKILKSFFLTGECTTRMTCCLLDYLYLQFVTWMTVISIYSGRDEDVLYHTHLSCLFDYLLYKLESVTYAWYNVVWRLVSNDRPVKSELNLMGS